LRTIMVDLTYLCEPLQSWCCTSNIKLLACTRGAHQTNGRSENSVKVVKRLTRINNTQAGTPSASLQPYSHACRAQFHNCTPSSTGPSPLTLWPAAHWQYPSSALHPWGCRVVGWVGKQTSDPNLAMRGAAGIYLGLNTQTTGYLVYHPDSDVVHTYPYIEARTPHVFPIKDMQWACELSCAWTQTPGADTPHCTSTMLTTALPQSSWPANRFASTFRCAATQHSPILGTFSASAQCTHALATRSS